MGILNDSKKKLKLNYPCEWRYKVIGEKKSEIERAVKSIMGQREHSLEFSKGSSRGKYHSYELKTVVDSEDDRVKIYEKLKKHDDLKTVL